MRVGEFLVRDAFALAERHLFCLIGEVVSGNLRAGLVATLATDADERFSHPIHGVEFLDRPGGDGGGYPALTFSYTSTDELDRWLEIEWTDATVQIETG